MIAELDIYRTAKIYIDQYGEEAFSQAIYKAEHYHEIGDETAMMVWSKIADAIEFMQLPTERVDPICH